MFYNVIYLRGNVLQNHTIANIRRAKSVNKFSRTPDVRSKMIYFNVGSPKMLFTSSFNQLTIENTPIEDVRNNEFSDF